jgi:alginate O-acetyltransferase complex protein AlgI
VARVEPGLHRFLLFVSFFPQLIAGPIVHWRELGPQLNRETMRAQRDVALGITLFIIGLAKKTLLADLLSPHVADVFDHNPASAGTIGAWSGVLAYTLQIYFDFSGYSDMAVGLALLFGVRLPWNFLSPYKAGSIVEFWRRWHITLSRFLRDYLYIPLGGNRHGPAARYRNILITMLLGGLWHGAGWNFVLWGGVHGALIGAQHVWNGTGLRMPAWFGWALTMLAVMLAWVLFRAANVDVAMDLYASMLGAGLSSSVVRPSQGTLLLLAGGTAIALFAPNAKHIADTVRLTPRIAVCCGLLGGAALLKQLYAGEVHEFIYFRF